MQFQPRFIGLAEFFCRSMLIVALASRNASGQPSLTRDDISLSYVVQQWQNWSEWVGDLPWENFTCNVNGPVDGGGWKWMHYTDGRFRLVRSQHMENGRLVTSTKFINPDYLAVVTRGGQKDCTLEQFTPISKSTAELRSRLFPTTLLLPLAVLGSVEETCSILSDRNQYDVLQYFSTSDGDDTLYHFHVRFKRQLGSRIVELKQVLSKQKHYLPILQEPYRVFPESEQRATIRFEDWRQVDGKWVWSRKVGRIEGDSKEYITLIDWRPATRISKKQCWLTFYGLPEPGETAQPSWPWILGLASVVMLGVAMLLRTLSR